MNNKTKIKIPKKYEKYIIEVWYEGEDDGYWANLYECCLCEDTDSHLVHEWTQKDFLRSLRSIRIMEEKEYISLFSDDNIESYYEDLKRFVEE